jgi:16S rRNA (cytosine1402-N4)-methyltransferase
MSEYHIPVMLKECIEGLEIKPGGVYVDLTFGGGGHTRAIITELKDGAQLFSFDQDDDATEIAKSIDHEGFHFIASNFRYLKKYLRLHGIKKVDGILADLGISSHQINVPERGFSYRFDAELDMRMDQTAEKDAKFVINLYPETELHRIFGMYGEVKNAKTLAARIVTKRHENPINTVFELLDAIDNCIPGKTRNKYLAQVFQAIRIEVNDEIKALEEVLLQLPDVLNEDGLLVVMSYHSLEDRLVKNFIAKGRLYGEQDKDVFGNVIKPIDSITRKPITPTDQELELNPRSRSAKLRIAKRNSQLWQKID